MTCKEYLTRFKRQQKEISILQEEISTLQAVRAVQYDKPNVKRSASGDGIINIVTQLMKYQAQYEEQIVTYLFERTRFLNELREMSERQGDVLRLIYMNGYTLKQVARELNYSLDWVAHVHGLALVEYERRYLLRTPDGELVHK